jgi:hypothetical protein
VNGHRQTATACLTGGSFNAQVPASRVPRIASQVLTRNKRNLCGVPAHWRSIVNGNILNSKGVQVAVVTGHEVFSLKGQKLYDLRGANIYKLNGDLVGHLPDAGGSDKHLDKATDRLFPAS